MHINCSDSDVTHKRALCNLTSAHSHSPPVEGSRSNDSDSDPLEEKAESTEDTPESLLPLLDDGSLHSEELRLSSSGPSRVWEIPESNCDSNSERLQSLSKGGAEARLRRADSGLACKDEEGGGEDPALLISMSEYREQEIPGHRVETEVPMDKHHQEALKLRAAKELYGPPGTKAL